MAIDNGKARTRRAAKREILLTNLTQARRDLAESATAAVMAPTDPDAMLRLQEAARTFVGAENVLKMFDAGKRF